MRAPAPALAPLPPSFAPTLDREAARWVDATLKSLSDDQLVGQVLMGRLDSTYLSADSAKFEELAALVRDVHIGGFCAFGGVDLVPSVMLNATYGPTILGQPLELAAILNRLQTLSTLPLIVGGDFEHGVGMRINGATRFPRAMAFGAAGDPALVREAARLTGLESRALGVHVNFAPVADVNNNPRNPVINIRSFGEDPARVGVLVRAAVEGLQSGGVVATLKHFPGHGDTAVDTHLGLATVPHDRARLDRVELAPFRDGIAAGAGAAMVAHVEMPALDPVPGPATFSRPVVRGLLRHELEFDGVIYTDSMLMDAVNEIADPGEAAVRALEAGVDVVLDSPDARAAHAAIKAAMAQGRVPRVQLEGSVRRVLAHKARLGLHKTRTVSLDGVMGAVGTRAGAETARVTAERAVTLLRDERQAVPLPTPRTGRVLYLSVLDYPSNWRIAAPSRTLLPELRKRWGNVTAVELSDRSTADELDLVRALAASSRCGGGRRVRARVVGQRTPRPRRRASCACCRTWPRPRRAASSRWWRRSSAAPTPPWPPPPCPRCSSPTTSATTPRPRPCGRWRARWRFRAACRWPWARGRAWASGSPARRSRRRRSRSRPRSA